VTSGNLDAAADGQFTGKLADPADTLTKRGGKGHVYFEGVSYTRLAWIRRSARLGHTLAAGEGSVLDAELERVTAMVEAAYLEGWSDALSRADLDEFPEQGVPRSADWYYSDARWLLTGEAV
jgi:hypothetical protein